MRNVVLVVGNGLAIDLRSEFPELPSTSRPLDLTLLPDYYFGGESMSSLDLRKRFPMLMRVLENVRNTFPDADDFKLMETLIQADEFSSLFATKHIFERDDYVLRNNFRRSGGIDRDDKKGLILAHLRLYIMYVFSYFDRCVPDDALYNWRWSSWMRKNHNRLLQVLSFNYDVFIERAYKEPEQADYILSGNDVVNTANRLMFSKPHGSINHSEPKGLSVSNLNWEFPEPDRVVEMFSGDVNVLPRKQVNRLRPFSDIVLPSQAAGMRRQLRHIQYGYQRLKMTGSQVDVCIIAGVSYCSFDRPEINEIIKALPNAKILICNPDPLPDLQEFLRIHGRNFSIVTKDLPII